MRFTTHYLFFFSEKDFLSNWYQRDFWYKGKRFLSVEHFMMAQKALLFNDNEAYTRIMHSVHPRDAKRIGREVKNYDDRRWAAIREKVVARGVFLKFIENPVFLSLFMATEGYKLVEASPNDKLYGVGLAIDDDRILNPDNWRGSNLLGDIETNVRDLLIEAADNGYSSINLMGDEWPLDTEKMSQCRKACAQLLAFINDTENKQ